MKKKSISLFLTGILLASTLAGCGNNAEKAPEKKAESGSTETSGQESGTDVSRTLKLYTHYGEGEKESVDYAIKKVQEKYPNIKFEIEAHAQDDGQTLKTRAATGDMPDIAHVNAGDVEALSASGSLLNLDELIKSTGYSDKLLDSAKDLPYYDDGTAYIFPDGGASAILLYYNKKVFEDNNIKIPTNYEELSEAAEQLKAKDIIPCSIFAKEGFVIGAFFDMFALKYNEGGIKALSEAEAHASDDGYSKAIDKMMKLVDSDFFEAGSTSTDYDTAQSLFTSGKAAMFINGDWDISSLEEKLGDDLGYFESYPTADAGKEQEQNYYAFSGGFTYEGYAISADTKDQELVADVAALLAEASVEGNYIYQAKIPAIMDVDPSLTPVKEIPALAKTEAEEIKKMVFKTTWTHTMKNVDFSTPFVELLQEMLTGMDADELKTSIDDLVDSVGGQE
ncbi:ABC transporter substrate-binding protein [Novisyntrophococcus fermenticellae]|uniref:ABC transporter substrate-binding protein n=1 Tax=Novisyntrophococcus fermenticellae TaxID=2068655 RepID=UPI001E2B01AE|nr:extracellular solute-binding protein [Novisyntrophococcus fermenticellae]